MKRIFLSGLLLLMPCLRLEAQVAPVSQVSGVVRDASGLPVPDAEVTITNTDTSASRTARSGVDGSYVITNLPAGPYTLQVKMPGFATHTQTGIVLQVNTSPILNVTLKVGTITETVEVQADAAMVETRSLGIGQVIDERRVIDLPLNGRDVSQLIALSGSAVAYTGTMKSNMNHAESSSYSVAGGQMNATNYVLDGGTHIDPRTNVGLPLPFPDAMQEFRVETSSLPASYGSQPGGAVNVITKSGTNSFHGNAFEFMRNGAMNARNFFAPTRDSLKRNQFGGTLGGPIMQNRLFFFGGFQGTTLRTAPVTEISYVPTTAVLQGDFRQILSPPCQAKQVTLPSTIAKDNILLPGVVDPVAMNFFARLPVATDPCGKIQYGIVTKTNAYQAIGKIDWQRTTKDSLFGRYYINDYDQAAYMDPDNLLTTRNGLPNRVQSITLGDTSVINTKTVSSFRLSYSRSAVQRLPHPDNPTMDELGSKITAMFPDYVGQVSATNYFSFPLATLPGYVYTNIYGVSENFDLALSKHQLSFGFAWNQTRMNSLGPFQMNPRMTFSGQITGNALADFMTGNMTTLLQGGGQIGREKQNSPSLFIQDNWKLSQWFSLSLGLRWEPFLPQVSKYGYAMRWDRAGFDAGKRSQVFVHAPPGMTFPGDPNFEGRITSLNPKYGLFAPRLGMALDPRGKGRETIRAGYGIFYGGQNYLWHTMHVPLNPPWGYTISLSGVKLSDPWATYPGGDPFPPPSEFPPDFVFPTSAKYVFEADQARPTYVQQWNLSFEKQLGTDWLVGATYMGNKTTHQWLSFAQNPAVYFPDASCTLGGVKYTPCSSTRSTDARRILSLADPQEGKYIGNLYITDDGANSSYNGMKLSLNRRFSRNYSALANYTWSHCVNHGEVGQDIASMYQNPYDRRAEWGNCDLDRRHIVNLSMVAQTPKFATKWLQAVAGNWGLSGIFNYYSGSSPTVMTGTDASLTAVGMDRPNVIGDPHLDNPTIDRWFDISAFERNAAGTYGNAGRGIIRGPSAWNVDTALWRIIPLKEGVNLDLRFETFNLFNHARFGNPTTTFTSGNFGRITTAADPRILQLAFKFVF
jgi:hypothetical protein